MAAREAAADSASRNALAHEEEPFPRPLMRWGLFWLLNLSAVIMTIIAVGSGERRWLALAVAVVLGTYLGVLAAVQRAEDPVISRTRTLLERLQPVPDWAVRVIGLSGAVAMIAGVVLEGRLGFEEFFAPAAAAGSALMGLFWLAGPRPFRFRRRV